MKTYGVVNLDILGSRNINGRESFLGRLEHHISTIYDKYSRILPTRISITLGDEWQLVTDSPSDCYTLVHEFQQLLWLEGVELYAGIGIGTLSTAVHADIRKMDGTSFHMAREALNIAKKQQKPGNLYAGSKSNRVYLQSDRNSEYGGGYTGRLEAAAASEFGGHFLNEKVKGLDFEDVINTIIENNEILKARMTQKQRVACVNYRRYGTYSEMIRRQSPEAAESKAAISQKLNTAEYATIQHNHLMVEQLLKLYI